MTDQSTAGAVSRIAGSSVLGGTTPLTNVIPSGTYTNVGGTVLGGSQFQGSSILGGTTPLVLPEGQVGVGVGTSQAVANQIQSTPLTSSVLGRTSFGGQAAQAQANLSASQLSYLASQQAANAGIYIPALNMFATGNLNLDQTAVFRPPTINEQTAINKADLAGSYSNLPPVKFLQGEYPFQKKTLKGTPINSNYTQEYSNYIQNTPTKDLLFTNPSAAVTKLFYTGGGEYYAAVKKVAGGGTTTPAEKQAAGQILGQAGLFTAFSPLISTGTYSEAQQLVDSGTHEWIYDYNKGQWVLKNKMTGTIETPKITPTEFVSNVRNDIVEKQAGGEQIRYLNDLYNKFFKGVPNGKENFQKLVQDLYASGEFKGIPLESIQSQSIKQSPLFEISSRLPSKIPITTLSNINPLSQIGQAQGSMFSDLTGSRIPDITKASEIPAFRNLNAEFSGTATLATDSSLQASSLLNSSTSSLAQDTSQTSTNALKSGQLQASSLLQPELSSSAQSMAQPEVLQSEEQQRIKLKGLNLLSPSDLLSNKRNKQQTKHIYQAITKRRGKEIVLGESTNPLKAERLAIGTALGTLARSVIVREKSTRMQVRLPNPSPQLFRQAKRNPLTYIQRNALSSRSETKEIQAAKRSSNRFKPTKSFKRGKL